MTNSYQNARKLLILFSAILIAWEYVGIEIGSSVKLPPVGTDINIHNPEIVPSLIFIMVLYFAFRYTVEWWLIPLNERLLVPLVVDRIVTYLVGLASIVVYVFQRTSEFRLAEHLSPEAVMAVGITLFILLINFRLLVFLNKERIPNFKLLLFAFLASIVELTILAVFIQIFRDAYLWSVLGLTLSLLSIGITFKIISLPKKQKVGKDKVGGV